MNLNNWQQISPKLGGISRAFIFRLWASGELASLKVGKLRFSTDEQIAAYINRQRTDAA